MNNYSAMPIQPKTENKETMAVFQKCHFANGKPMKTQQYNMCYPFAVNNWIFAVNNDVKLK